MSRVLVVDDSMTQRQLMTTVLEDNGLTVSIASDGKEALEQLQSIQPDIVVLDVVMPGMNGYEVCRSIKKDPNTQNVPVVMCSSKSEDFDRYWGMRQGADAYINKPFEPQEFLATVQTLLQG